MFSVRPVARSVQAIPEAVLTASSWDVPAAGWQEVLP